nr:RHS repeat-associated core domain-containing protein [Bacteroides faecis]
MPSQVSFTEGNVIEYEYGADGRKLRTLHMVNNVTSTTDYCGNAIYENGSLKMLLNEAGYISFPDKKFHFYLKDHQGNIRVVADKDGNVEETNDYYPFGGLFTASTSVQPYKYNGKELDRKNGIDWYDYGARHYDPAIGRWHVVDPMSKKYYSWSPYTYCKNNPVLRIDLDGKDDYIVSETGRLTRLNVPTETDILYTYSGDSKNPKGGNKIEMTEKGLLEEMVKVQQSHNGYKSFGASTNIADASNLFQFVAENTKVEWSLSVFESGGVHTAIIATDQQPNTVQNGISAKNNLGVVGESKVQIHSHPDSGGTKGGYGNDLRNANPKSKNLVYFQANRILYEYNNTKSNIKETPVVEKNRYI